MTWPARIFFYTLLIVYAAGAVFLEITYDVQSNSLFIMGLVVWFVALLIYLYWPTYVFFKSTNMRSVERVLEKRKKVPFIAYNAALVKGDWQEAEWLMKKIRNIPKAKRAMMQNVILMAQANAEQRADLLANVQAGTESAAYLHALHFLKTGNREEFERYFQQVKTPGRQQVLLAEASYQAGDLANADCHAQQAFSLTKGLQRYLLLKSLERSEAKGEQRTSYF